MLAVNQNLLEGRFRIIKPFGQGKTVSFFEAFDNILDKSILLKRIEKRANESEYSVAADRQDERFVSESRFLSEINNDGFLQIFDFFFEDNAKYLVMELVDGNNFGDLVKKSEEPFAIGDVVDWGDQILSALNYLHKSSPPIIYFNLRPQNLHLTSEGKIKLLSTGIGLRPGEEGNVTLISFNELNVNYCPLELIWQQLDAGTKRVIIAGYDDKAERMLVLPPDERSDIYSVGAILYQLLTNQMPADALERTIEVLEGKVDPLIAPNELNSSISDEISEFLVKALQISRENRFQSAAEMRHELASAYAILRERKAQLLRNEGPAQQYAPNRKPLHLAKTEIIKAIEASTEGEANAEAAAIAVDSGNELGRVDLSNNNSLSGFENQNQKFSDQKTESIGSEIKVKKQVEAVWSDKFEVDWDETTMKPEEWRVDSSRKNESKDFPFMLGQRVNEGRTMKRLTYAAISVLLVGGGVLGAIKLMPSAGNQGSTETTTKAVPAIKSGQIVQPTPKVLTSEPSKSGEVQKPDFAVETSNSNAAIHQKAARSDKKQTPEQIASSVTTDARK
jgi:serine/threonine protein kinase